MNLPNALAEIIGQAFVSAEPAACAQFAVQGCAPGCVAAPGSAEELAAVLAAAHTQGAAVVPWGGGTQQLIGNPPAQIDLVVRTERLQRVLIHEPGDLTISVEAGMTLGALRSHLAAHGQMLPVDAPLPERATIGGLIATAMDGPRRLGYGTLRDLLIGIQVVDAAGHTSKAGGMVVKNVSGFDMMKLYHGSFGTLALIASANFKLLPAPRESTALLCRFGARAAAFRFLADLHASQLTPTAAEYLNPAALQQLGLGPGHAVFVVAEGLAQAVARHAAELGLLAAYSAGQAEQRADHRVLLQRIADLPQTLQLGEQDAVIKLSILPGDLEAALERMEAYAPLVLISARALDGVAYARLAGSDAAQLAMLAAELPGLHWVATTLADVPRWGDLGEGAALMRQIKHEFDPQGRLNPGRYVV
ncbi:MAG: FAD-binding oxidoreductase [Roseiflexaceae bacterium]|nr:FAD-binding oxidoreductase [Roseiflexaceae bacterium]